jgi:hypothetical protein
LISDSSFRLVHRGASNRDEALDVFDGVSPG